MTYLFLGTFNLFESLRFTVKAVNVEGWQPWNVLQCPFIMPSQKGHTHKYVFPPIHTNVVSSPKTHYNSRFDFQVDCPGNFGKNRILTKPCWLYCLPWVWVRSEIIQCYYCDGTLGTALNHNPVIMTTSFKVFRPQMNMPAGHKPF